MQFEVDMAFLHAGGGVVIGRPDALVPDDDGAAAIFTLGDGAFEGRIVDRMVLHMHGQPLLVRVEAGAACDRPAPQNAAMLETQVVMQARRRMLVDDEDAAAGLAARHLAGRLGCLGEIALGAVFFEAVRQRYPHP